VSKVLIQLVGDAGEIQSGSALIEDATLEDAQLVMTAATKAAERLVTPTHLVTPADERCVTEFHYRDGDIGVYDDLRLAAMLWTYFTKRHQPSHILIRPDTEDGQRLSSALFRFTSDQQGTAAAT
jgi:hypothetical protein